MTRDEYANVNGLKMYYEIHGKGQPLILLHGGLGTIGMFAQLLPALAENGQVVAIFFSPMLASTVMPFLDAPMPDAK